MGFASPAVAADKMVTKAPAAEPVQWWYEGFAEVGGRFNLNGPDKTTLGKFYEYRDLRPGVFGNFSFGAHRTGPDPLDIVAWGKNVGWDDQAFGLEFARPGQYYITLGWDETPHVFSKNARTTYSGLGGNVLTTPTYPYPPAVPGTSNFVAANSNTVDVKYRRDTASAAVRWTPTDNWDVNIDYSHMHRKGTQPLNMVTFTPNTATNVTRAPVEVPKPVDDTTQNGNVKGEYAGSTPWGKQFNVALGYGVSVYNNDVGCASVAGYRTPGSPDANCLTVQSPWNAANAANGPFFNRYSLAPDNNAQTFSLSGGVGLPWNSRYMGTVQYSIMRQNETFMTSTINPLVAPATLSASSLNGDARTTLINNVLTTQIMPDLKSTLRYRYYDYHSKHAPVTITGLFANPDTGITAETPLTPTPLNFNKQNASAELVWRSLKWLNTGAAYEWERRSRELNAVNVVTLATGDFDLVTNENAAKVFADANVGSSSTLRTSLRYGERRFDGDYIRIANNNNAFRTVDAQDRKSTIAKASWAIDVTNTVTITPNAGYRYDDYPADGRTTIGINEYKSWNAGGDIAWTVSPLASLYLSYIHDDAHRNVFQRTLPSDLVLDTTDFTDTFIFGGKWTAIPDKLFLNATYAFTRSTSKWSSTCGPGGCNAVLVTAIFPDIHNTNHRVDVQAKYMLDPTLLRNGGFFPKSQAYVKARVLWEKNSNDSWQGVQQMLGLLIDPTNTTTARAVFLATGNPNYDIVVGQIAFGLQW